MSDRHTQGPWVVQYQEGDKPFVVADQGKQWNNPVVCSLYEDVTPEDSVTMGAWLEANENAEANARLIAAAPDLLDFVISYLENYHSEDGMFDSKYYAKRAAELIAKVKTK